MYKNILGRKNTNYYGDMKEEMWNLREGVLNMALFYLKSMEHSDLAEALQGKRSTDKKIFIILFPLVC